MVFQCLLVNAAPLDEVVSVESHIPEAQLEHVDEGGEGVETDDRHILHPFGMHGMGMGLGMHHGMGMHHGLGMHPIMGMGMGMGFPYGYGG